MNPDTKILVIDDVPPESNAMLQALYSRSPQSVTTHLEKVKQVGPEKFMGSYYVGYGHKSIGDCGTTTIYIENVSLLAAKAIQDWPLYNGQEASTRYLNMATQSLVDPLKSKQSKIILDEWMRLYTSTLDALIPFLKERFPKDANQDEKIWDKAIKAKAFDIARGLLPAGITTLLSWHTNLRQAYDHIKVLKYHPLAEIREIAESIHAQLKQKYPNSFSHKTYDTQEKYLALSSPLSYFNDKSIGEFKTRNLLDKKWLKTWSNKNRKILTQRPIKTELPAEVRKFGNIVFTFLLDFGSYRDLQRHRSMVCPMPLLTTKYKFAEWYLTQLPADLRKNIEKSLKEQEKRIAALKCDDATRQNYIAIGYNITCEATCSLPSAVYVAELRSSQTVHPTLRVIAQKMGKALKKIIPEMALHCDNTPDTWDIKRGTHDIVKK